MDEIVEPNHPNHVGIILIEGDKCKIAGQCMMIPAKLGKL
jgi:hypothetical protein